MDRFCEWLESIIIGQVKKTPGDERDRNMPETRVWFIQRNEKIYGPFPLQKMEAFIVEGRVRSNSMVTISRNFPLQPAQSDPNLRPLLEKLAAASVSGQNEKKDSPAKLDPTPPTSSVLAKKMSSPLPANQPAVIVVKPAAISKPTLPAGTAFVPTQKSKPSVEPVASMSSLPERQATGRLVSNNLNKNAHEDDWPADPTPSTGTDTGHDRKTSTLKNFLVFVVLAGGLLAGSLWLIKSKNPTKQIVMDQLEQSSKIRTLLKHPPLPMVWELWTKAILEGLNFSEKEILKFHELDIKQKKDLNELLLPPDISGKVRSSLNFIQAGGFYFTYLFDNKGYAFAVCISHANFQRLELSHYDPQTLGPKFEVIQGPQSVLWVTPVLDDFKGTLIWNSSEEKIPLNCLLLSEK